MAELSVKDALFVMKAWEVRKSLLIKRDAEKCKNYKLNSQFSVSKEEQNFSWQHLVFYYISGSVTCIITQKFQLNKNSSWSKDIDILILILISFNVENTIIKLSWHWIKEPDAEPFKFLADIFLMPLFTRHTCTCWDNIFSIF